MALWRASAVYTDTGGTDGRTAVQSTVSEAAATGLLAAEQNLKTGISTNSASVSRALVAGDYPLAGSGASQPATFTLLHPASGVIKIINLKDVSTAFRVGLDNSIDETDPDVDAWLTAYNTAHGLTYIIKDAHYD
jgi:predicted TIM-barrel enzyme